MAITYNDIKHKLQFPLDCAEIKDLRGKYFHNRIIINYENTDFTGCVLYHCWPSGFLNALEYNPAKSEAEVTLKGADLREAYFKGAELEGANLQGANLQEAYFDLGTSLYGANLQEADLRRAYLETADLGGTNLQGANLQGANLQGVNLMGANLQGAKLEGANLLEADLFRADLQYAQFNSVTVLPTITQGVPFLPDMITQEQFSSMIFVEDDED